MNGIGFLPVHLAFDQAQDTGYGKGHNKVEYAGDEKDLEIPVVVRRNRLALKKQLGYGYDVEDRRVFDIDHELVARGRQDVADDLRQDDAAHGLRVAHAD